MAMFRSSGVQLMSIVLGILMLILCFRHALLRLFVRLEFFATVVAETLVISKQQLIIKYLCIWICFLGCPVHVD